MKKMKVIFTAASIIVGGLVGGANATDDTKAGSGPNPFSDCGIGAALFPETKWAAVTSNVIWDVGTTALTSATASPETCSGKKVEVAEFISRSYDNLVLETAKGEGEYLNAMLDIHECSAEAKPLVVNEIRMETSKLLSDDQYVEQNRIEKISNYFNAVEKAVSSQADHCAA